MKHFASATSVGVVETFVVMGLIYCTSMMIGALAIRVPPADWKPEGWTAPVGNTHKLITRANVHIDEALKTRQFYLLWVVLWANVTAGIGVLGQASVMIQESFKGSVTPAAAAGFVGLLSLFNMLGRFFWASSSDRLGRKNTYLVFFILGGILYWIVPGVAKSGNVALFVAAYAVILSMYGGGFATIPAYLADIFGTAYVGGIHGRLLTAWAAAGISGPALVNYIRAYQVQQGVTGADAYGGTLHIMAGLLMVGLVCNWLVSAVDDKHHINEGGKPAQEDGAHAGRNQPTARAANA